MRTHRLYIDETGTSNPVSKKQPLFIICACVVPDSVKEKIKLHADQIKYKYWGLKYAESPFHSCDMGKKEKHFDIFRDKPELYAELIKDICKFMRTSEVKIFVSVVDKTQAKNWDTDKVLKEVARHTISSFVYYIVGAQIKGKVVIESATNMQNTYFLKEFSYYLSPKAIEGVDFRVVQNALTSISFVTKKNDDIEAQLVDLFAYAARCKYELESDQRKFAEGSYEARIVKILNKKLFAMPGTNDMAPERKEILNRIEPYKILTKKKRGRTRAIKVSPSTSSNKV